MNSTGGQTKIIYSDQSERERIIGQQIGENYRLDSEKLLSDHRIALIFVPIIFRPVQQPSKEMKERFWKVKEKIDKQALNKNKTN